MGENVSDHPFRGVSGSVELTRLKTFDDFTEMAVGFA
jgi:hypothetical protein